MTDSNLGETPRRAGRRRPFRRHGFRALYLFLAVYAGIALVTAFTPMGPLVKAKIAIAQEHCRTIYLRRNTLHTAFVIRAADLRELGAARLAALTSKKWLDISWGDHRYFSSWGNLTLPDRIATVANALLWPSMSSIYVAGYDVDPKEIYQGIDIPYFNTIRLFKGLPRDVVPLQISSANLANLVHYIDGQFENLTPIQNGQFADGRFFLSTTRYHLLATCNAWIAEGLRQAGFRISPRFTLVPSRLVGQLDGQSATQCTR